MILTGIVNCDSVKEASDVVFRTFETMLEPPSLSVSKNHALEKTCHAQDNLFLYCTLLYFHYIGVYTGAECLQGYADGRSSRLFQSVLLVGK